MQRRLTRGAAALVLGGALVGRTQAALAAPSDGEPLDLDWSAPSGCPSRATVLDDIARILDRPSSELPLTHVAARAAPFRGEDGLWHVVLTISGDPAAERTLDASTCEELANAAALVLALRVDPTLLAPEMIPTASLPASAPPETSTSPPSDAVNPPSTKPQPTPSAHIQAPQAVSVAVPVPSRNHLVVGALLVGGLGEMPSVDVGAEVVAAWKHDRLRLEPFFASGLMQQAHAPGDRQEGASVLLVRGGLRGCYAALDRRFSLSGCLAGEVDGLWVDGSGTPDSKNQSTAYVALGAGALATWRLTPRVALRAQIEGLLPLSQPRFVIEDSAGRVAKTVYNPYVIAGRAAIGVEVSFF